MRFCGHAFTQALHATHFEESTFAIPSTIFIASNLHASLQLPNPKHPKLHPSISLSYKKSLASIQFLFSGIFS